MIYELYVDSLFLVNFVMNLYLLLLVNRSLYRAVTGRRIIFGAGISALLYFLPFLFDGPLWLKMTVGAPLGSIIMIVVVFRVRNIRGFLEILERILLYSVLMGGAMLLVIKKSAWVQNRMTGIWGILGMGAVLYMLFDYLSGRRVHKDSLCRTTLIHKGNRITVTALIDSGNSLTEPISGEPVSIIEKDLIPRIWGEEPELYRAIPYHSIGKKRGILRGYLMPEIQIEIGGVTKVCKKTYVAVCEEYITSAEHDNESHVKMILNPLLLTGPVKYPGKRRE